MSTDTDVLGGIYLSATTFPSSPDHRKPPLDTPTSAPDRLLNYSNEPLTLGPLDITSEPHEYTLPETAISPMTTTEIRGLHYRFPALRTHDQFHSSISPGPQGASGGDRTGK
jgi:hypothetical protein